MAIALSVVFGEDTSDLRGLGDLQRVGLDANDVFFRTQTVKILG